MAKGKYQQWLEPDGLTLISGWAKDGNSHEKIADLMHISVDTLYEWRKKYPEISEALKRNHEISDYSAEDALGRRACGYTVTERTTTKDMNGDIISVVEKERHIPPDTAALIFYLKNRMPKKWKDKPVDEADEEQLKKLEKLLGGIPSAF